MQFGFYDHVKLAWKVGADGQIEMTESKLVRPGWDDSSQEAPEETTVELSSFTSPLPDESALPFLGTTTLLDRLYQSAFGNLEEAATLLDLGYRNYDIFQVLMDTDITNQYTVTNGANSVAVGPATEVRALLPKGVTKDDLQVRYILNESSVTAPIEIGQTLATMQVWYENVCVAQAPVVSRNAVKEYIPVEERNTGTDTDTLITVLTVTGVILGIILCVLGVMFTIQLVRRAGAQAQRRRRRQSRRRSR